MKVKNPKSDNSSENCILKLIHIEQDGDKFIASIPKKKNIFARAFSRVS